ncbi:MAG: AAA family ATPase [Pseudonocardiales bacterium]
MARRVTCPTFVGRGPELRRLDEAADAATHEGRIVLIAGDAGVGKTRLIEELCARRRACGATTAVGGCVDLGDVGVGFAPLIEVLRSFRSQLGPDKFDELLDRSAPELRPLLAGGRDGHAALPGAVLAHTLALLDALGDQRAGAVVAFEDLHWADASTRDLVAFLARNLRTAKVVLVLSYREDDLHRRHPLRPLLAELARNAAVEHVQLGRMTRSELTVLLAGVGGVVPTDGVVDAVMARSEGNPFYAEELLALGGTGPLPLTLRDAILARVARLAEPVQAVLREAAVLGDEVDERLIAGVTGRAVHEVGSALRDAVAHQVLVLGADGCRFRHALVREALYEDLLPGERQRLHETAASVINARPELAGGPEHVRWARLAYHWDAAEDQANAFAASVRAGVESETVGALAEATTHFQRALELWPRVTDPEGGAGMAKLALVVRAADAASHTGEPAQAVALMESALALLDENAAPPETPALVLERLGGHRAAVGDVPGSEQAHQASVELLADAPPSEVKALCIAALGRHQMLVGRLDEAETKLREAMAVNATVGSSAVQINVLSNLGAVLVQLGRIDEGMAALIEALRLAEHEERASDISGAYLVLTGAFIVTARYQEAADLAATALSHARQVGMEASIGSRLACNRAWALLCLGHWDEATELLAAAAARHGDNGAHAAGIAARLALWRGDSDEAAAYCDRALQAPNGHLAGPERLAFAADVAAGQGRFAHARALARDALAVIEPTDDLWVAAVVFAIAMQVEADCVDAAPTRGPRAEDVAEARAVADELLMRAHDRAKRLTSPAVAALPEASAWLAVTEADHGRAWGRSDPDRWAAAAKQFDTLLIPYPAAVARLREADAVLRGRGSRLRATDAARIALATAERIGAKALTDQVRLLAQRARLELDEAPAAATPEATAWADLGISPREEEVLALLAHGRSNHEIAKELFISEKTASVHVTHLLRKLGVASRVEAAAIGQRIGMGPDVRPQPVS